LNDKLLEVLKNEGISDFSNAEYFLKNKLKELQTNGDLTIGEDKNLIGNELELRVEQLFIEYGFNIAQGRDGKEDFIVTPSENNELPDKIVIEVKSSKKSCTELRHLRQLDDWVYDLSGEEGARKNGINSSSPLNTFGLGVSKKHPTPHKGLLVFNNSVGLEFENRPERLIHSNQEDFVMKRNFCIIRLDHLVSLLAEKKEDAWQVLHETVGEYVNQA